MWKFAFMFFFSISLLLGGGIVEVEAACESTAISGALSQAKADLDRCKTAIREKNWSNYVTYMRSAEAYYNRAVGYAAGSGMCAAEIAAVGSRIKITKNQAAIARSVKPKSKYRLPPGAPAINIPRN